MKKTLLMACTLLALTAGFAAAGPGGLNLGWGDCGGLPASLNRTFACNTNTGGALAHTLVGSYVAPCCITAATSNEIVVDVQTVGVSLTPWWGLRSSAPAGCRAGSLTASADFGVGPFACFDYWASSAVSAVSADPPVGNRERIKGLVVLPAGSPVIGPVPEGLETYSFKFTIANQKTTGLGACEGCLQGACIVLNSIKVTQPIGTPGGDKFISAMASRNWVTWQGGIIGNCYGDTPAKNNTWGSVKALYR